VTNDRTMQAILTAAQEDNKLSQNIVFESHELAQSMKNDSVAMKTVSVVSTVSEVKQSQLKHSQIAILTMLFLPGTSFAVSSCRTSIRP
jgi:hypothetical protein